MNSATKQPGYTASPDDSRWSRRRWLGAATALTPMASMLDAYATLGSTRNPEEGRMTTPSRLHGDTMGTQYRVLFADVIDPSTLQYLHRRVDESLARTTNAMSTYHDTSELERFNKAPAGHWQSLGTDTSRVLKTALDIKAHSRGAFDPCLNLAVEQWGFGRVSRRFALSEPSRPITLHSAGNIEFDTHNLRVRKHAFSGAINLNAIAKGDALDQVATLLADEGINDYLIEIGGEVLTNGRALHGKHWRVGIEHPSGGIHSIINVADQAVATSGDYLQYFMHRGQRYSHILDPRTGHPVEHTLALVSVVAPQCILADAWSTALFVMGPDAGYEFARETGMAALFLTRMRTGYREQATPSFAALRVRSKAGA